MTDLAGTGPVTACPEAIVSKRAAARDYVLDIVIPVFDEERDLPGSVRSVNGLRDAQKPASRQVGVE